MHIPILYQDEDIVVVDKPIGIPTHAPEPTDPYPGDVLRLVQRQTGLGYLGMHQRLDAETSGVLLFAARREANRALAAAFEGREARKAYIAIVRGAPQPSAGTVDVPIVRGEGGRYQVAERGDRRAQAARTRYQVLASTGLHSLLEVIPETGRSHQIRVHLAHLGHPIAGDWLYGPRGNREPRLCLHAHRLVLPHPATGQAASFSAPLPPPFDQFRAGVPGLELAVSGAHIRDAAHRPEALRQLLDLAVDRRRPLASDPATTIFRVVNSAADGLNGLTVDRYGDVAVMGVYDEGVTAPAALPQVLVETVAASLEEATLYVKYRPRQASKLSDEEAFRLAPPAPMSGAARPECVAREEGLSYLIRPGAGLNTGLFADMREVRWRVRHWSAARRVLNCFAYTCAFGVAALAGGAERVLNLDLSRSALAWGQENYRLNGLAPDARDFVYGDVFDWLHRMGRRGESFDLVILDPPGFSRAEGRSFSAARDYDRLAALAASVVAREGLLLACCNVAGLPWRRFRDRVLAGTASAGRSARVLGNFREPAVDFPAAGDGELYLKMLLLELG